MSEWSNKDWANNAPKFLDTNYPGNTNVYLVNSNRMHNANSVLVNAIAHQGWVKVYPGEGSLEKINVSVPAGHTYANANLVFTGANTKIAKANITFNGVTAKININDIGSGYTSNTIITTDSAEANNALLTFTFSGGRIGRNSTETLVAMSNVNVTSATSGGYYFPGK